MQISKKKPKKKDLKISPQKINKAGVEKGTKDRSDREYSVDYYDEDINEYADMHYENLESPTRVKEEDSDSESGLSELTNEVEYFGSKVIYQKRALFIKNVLQ